MRGRRARRQHALPELNITAFMNLMVVLVPFLLITAVFSQVAVLQLMMPVGGVEPAAGEALQLELVIEADGLALRNAAGKTRLLARLPMRDGRHDLAGLTEQLHLIKQRYPGRSDIALLAQPDTSYDTIIQLMDAVRLRRISQGLATVELELFPDIAIGDATVAKGAAR